MKKKLLFIYPSMIVGGSTTALLSLLNNLDPKKYEIDLQLFRNKGPLLEMIPKHVNLLAEAEIYKGAKGRLIKILMFLFRGHVVRYLIKKWEKGNPGSALVEFQTKELSRKNPKEYDYAIGFLEGWSDWYLAFDTVAKTKYAWLHSTYANITNEPTSELPWMERVDKIVFVTEACRKAFDVTLPQMAKKSFVIENITDSSIIRERSMQIDKTDGAYKLFSESDKFKIVTVCRLTISVKGLDRIVAAARELKKQGYDFLWYIIGDGEDRETLEKSIKEAEVGDCVVPIGMRMNPYPYVAMADIMCMPSRYEGKPIVVTESMILGTPPIVTRYLSAEEQIQNEKEGIVVENCDNAILEPLRRCISDRQLPDMLRSTLRSCEYGNTDRVKRIEEILFF